MLPASNRGAGQNVGFPDVCVTPAAPAPLPIPYPNVAQNILAAPFSATVFVTGMPALNMGSSIPTTMGDQAGRLSPSMGAGRYTMGNPIVFIDGMPAINLTCPTSGNNMVNPSGAVVVPSAVNVFYCRRGPESGDPTDPHARSLGARDLEELGEDTQCASPRSIAGTLLAGGVGHVPIPIFSADVGARVFTAIRELSGAGMRALILDLRGNPGGALDASAALAGDFLPEGAALFRVLDADGDETILRGVGRDPYSMPLAILVDEGTASAAELFAGCLQAHGRAAVIGRRTHGKACAQRVSATTDGSGAAYHTALLCRLPDGGDIERRGLCPDIEVEARGEAAIEAARALTLFLVSMGPRAAPNPGALRAPTSNPASKMEESER